MFGKPNFFVTEYNWPRGRSWYEGLFDGERGPTTPRSHANSATDSPSALPLT